MLDKIEIVLNQIDHLEQRSLELHPDNIQAQYDIMKTKAKLKKELYQLCIESLL